MFSIGHLKVFLVSPLKDETREKREKLANAHLHLYTYNILDLVFCSCDCIILWYRCNLCRNFSNGKYLLVFQKQKILTGINIFCSSHWTTQLMLNTLFFIQPLVWFGCCNTFVIGALGVLMPAHGGGCGGVNSCSCFILPFVAVDATEIVSLQAPVCDVTHWASSGPPLVCLAWLNVSD